MRFYHVTKLSKVPAIKSEGLKTSAGIAAGGMSADSATAYQYAEQDKGLIYFWTDEGYTDKFKKEGVAYAMLIVDVDPGFIAEHMRPPKQPKGTAITGTTAVCDIAIPVKDIYYQKLANGPLFELAKWGAFDMALDKSDKTIYAGEK